MSSLSTLHMSADESDRPGVSAAAAIDIQQYIDALNNSKITILLFALFFMLLGGIFALRPAPYEAIATIKLDNSGTSGIINTGGLNIDSEIGTVHSWTTVKNVLADMQYYAVVESDTKPNMATNLMKALGNQPAGAGQAENIEPALAIKHLNLPSVLNGQRVFLKIDSIHSYLIMAADDVVLFRGEFGKTYANNNASFADSREPFIFHIDNNHASIGSMFHVTPLSEQAMIERMMKQMEVTKRSSHPNSSLIDVKVANFNPGFALQFLDKLVEHYIHLTAKQKNQSSKKLLINFKQEIKGMQQSVEKKEQALTDFYAANGTIDIEQETRLLLQNVMDLENKLGDTKMQLAEAELIYQGQHPTIAMLQDRIIKLKTRIETLRQRAETLPHLQSSLFSLQRELDVATDLYSAAIDRYARIEAQMTAMPGLAHIVNEPRIKSQNLGAQAAQIITLSVILGVLIALSLVLLRLTARSQRIDTVDDLQAMSPFPVVGMVPHDKREAHQGAKAHQTSISITQKGSKTTSHLKTIESQFSYLTHGAGNNVIAFASDIEEQGKSFVSLNLALLSASKRKTLFIDCDIKHSSIHTVLKCSRVPGLADIITGQTTFEDALVEITDEKFYYLPPGLKLMNYQPLMDKRRFSELVDKASKAFDVVIIDFPAFNQLHGRTTLLDAAGAVFHVIKQGRQIEDIELYFNQFASNEQQVNSLLLNDVKK